MNNSPLLLLIGAFFLSITACVWTYNLQAKLIALTTHLTVMQEQSARLQAEIQEMRTETMALGAAVTTTASSDTLETFRTNVNTDLAELALDNVSTTTAQTWTALQTFLGNATSTQLTATSSAYLATSAGRVGVGSTSPFTLLSVGNTGTSTISGHNFCMYFKDEAGRAMWVKLATSGSHVFSTSTTACN